jgi:hypothetical protein
MRRADLVFNVFSFQTLVGSLPTTIAASAFAFFSAAFFARSCNFPAYSRSIAACSRYNSRTWARAPGQCSAIVRQSCVRSRHRTLRCDIRRGSQYALLDPIQSKYWRLCVVITKRPLLGESDHNSGLTPCQGVSACLSVTPSHLDHYLRPIM